MNYLSPSLLSADFATLGEQVRILDQAGAQYVHIDVMDGMFVPSISFGMPVMKSIRPLTKRVFDVHLMIENPDRYFSDFKEAGADLITVHAEACTHLNRSIQAIHDLGLKAAVALNPATSLHVLDYILPDLDMVLIMSVNPGFGGQAFLPSSLDKIRELKERINQIGKEIAIEVDGGVNLTNAKEVLDAGANVLVSGTGVFKGNIRENVEAFLKLMGESEQRKDG